MEIIAGIGAGTQVIAAGTGIVQAYLQRRQIYGVSQPTVKEIRKDLNEGVGILGAVRTDFEDEVKKNTTRVRSRIYVEWWERAKKIEDKVTDLIARYDNQSNEKGWYMFITPRGDFKGDMKRMHKKVDDLVQESEKIRDKILVDSAAKTIVEEKAPDIRKYRTLQKPLEEILKWLKIDKVKTIGIYGIVGIGKTTIMKNLNNHNEVAEMFDIVIWLKVSGEEGKKNRSEEDLQNDIARRLKLTMAGTSNAKEVAKRISTELEGKRYLLLLDNVKEYLDLPEIGIPDSNNGSKIVLTTRLHLVSNSMAEKEIKVSYLSTDEARAMFRDVLGDADQKIAPLVRKVCRECGGLPLLIEKVASTFKLKKNEILWRDGWNCWMMWPLKECEGIREVYELLRFCYNDLKDERYEKCFLYGALYPEDSNINTDSLLECWEAENLLVHENDVRKKRIMAGVLILNHLKNVSLIEAGKERDHVTMNQFIRQVALYIQNYPECNLLVETDKNLRKPPDENSWIDKTKISLGANEFAQLPPSPECSKLTTLFLQANKCLEIIPQKFFEHMKELQVLDLSDTGIKSLPPSLRILIKLKVLHVNNCKELRELPSHIDQLGHLEFLDIHGSGINGIPLCIKNMNLKYLWVSFGNGNEAQGVSFNYNMISELSALEELVIDFESFQQWTNAAENIMNEVAKLKTFKKLRVYFPKMIVDVIKVAPESVSINVPEARALLSYIPGSSWEEVRNINSFQFFIGLENGKYCQHPNFVDYEKYVKYCNGTGSNTPILKDVLKKAEGFELVNHKDVKKLSDFGTANMKQIQGFLIESCNAIETIMDTVGCEFLPNLEEMIIKNLPMLQSIWKEGPCQPVCQDSKLTTLVISNCRVLVNVFPPGAFQQLCVIQYLTIEKCDEVEEIFPQGDPRVNVLLLPNLRELILFGMKKLRRICAVESLILPSLEKLKIFKCPNLRKLPFNKKNVENLNCIEAEKEWWGALQWGEQEDKEELEELYMPLEI